MRVHLAQNGVELPSVQGVAVARNREFLTLRDASILQRDPSDGSPIEIALSGDYDAPRRLIVGLEPVR